MTSTAAVSVVGAPGVTTLVTAIAATTTAEDPVLATEALNSIVFFRDFFQDRYPVKRADFQPVSRGQPRSALVSIRKNQKNKY